MDRVLALVIVFFLIVGCVDSESPEPPVEHEEEKPSMETAPPIKEDRLTDRVAEMIGGQIGCSDNLLSVPLVGIETIDSITPLGNLNPPEHTLPTQHMYIHLNTIGVELTSPADMWVTGVTSNENLEEGTKDYGLTLALCEDITIYFLHIKELSPELLPLLEEARCQGGGKYEHCYNNLGPGGYVELKAGDFLGKVGNEYQTNFDFGAFDLRHTNEFVNMARYPSRGPNIVCPLDLYEEGTKEEFYEKVERTKDPICGKVMHDVQGTLKGNWFLDGVSADSPESWGNDISFADNNFDSPSAMISVGGVITGASRWGFTPEREGMINRVFQEVTPDGEIYCYESLDQGGRIVLTLEDEATLKIEHQNGRCGGHMDFVQPSYFVR